MRQRRAGEPELVVLSVATIGVLGLVGTAFYAFAPQGSRPEGYHPLVIATLAVTAVIVAAVGRRRPQLFSVPILTYALPVSVVLLAAAAWLAGPRVAPLVSMFFLWYATTVTFLPRRVAVALMGWVAVVYGAFLAIRHGNAEPLYRWEITIGTMVSTAVSINKLVERCWALAESEQAARARAERDRAGLEVANEEKSRFLARMSHELRTPLNGIIGFSQMLAQRSFGGLNAKQAEYVDDIVDSGRHLLALVDDVLDLAKVETGTVELDVAEVDLTELLAQSLTLFKEQAGRRRVRLVLDVDSRLASVEGDARKLKQVVFNLLANAVRFTPAGGCVTLRARSSDDRVRISVVDTGPGVAGCDRETIFEEFRQAESGRSHGGTGLGLPLARRLVSSHGGRLWVESEPGTGAAFIAELPVRQAATSVTGRRSPATGRTERLVMGEPDSRERRVESARILAVQGTTLLFMVVVGLLAFAVHPVDGPPIRWFAVGPVLAVAVAIVAAVLARPQWVGAPTGPRNVCFAVCLLVPPGLYALPPFRDAFGIILAAESAAVMMLLPWRDWLAQLGLFATAYAIALTYQPDYPAPLAVWVIVTAFAAVTGVIFRIFVTRIERLTLAERAARAEAERVGEQLETAGRHKAEFLANMSHELRTPLNVIIGFSEVLESEAFGPLNEKQAEYVADIVDSGRHLLALINDILDLAKIDAGRMDLVVSDVDVASALAITVAPRRAEAAARQIDLRVVETGTRLGRIAADEPKLLRTLEWVMANALKCSADGGRVMVEAVPAGDHVTITVQDTGPVVSHCDDGRGELGLVLARRYAELHGGSLEVRREAGAGPIFTLRLPREASIPSPATVEVG